MTSIRHTRTLFEYDGPQLFEAHDDDGVPYVALLIEHTEGADRYLAVEVTGDQLDQLKAGFLDLRELIAAAGSERWYVVSSSDLTSPLTLDPTTGPVPPEHLPKAGFRLSEASIEEEEARPPSGSVEARERLVEAVTLDLVGPWAGHRYAVERLRGWTRPSNWYLTGFLIPTSAPPEGKADQDEDDDLDTVPDRSGLAEESAEERKTAKKGFFPSSIGLSFLADDATRDVSVLARWGDYERRDVAADGEDETVDVWQRKPMAQTVRVALDRPNDYDVPSSGGMQLSVAVREVDRGHTELPAGTKSVSVFLVNKRSPDPDDPDHAYAFQAQVEVRSIRPFVPRPDLRGARGWDEQMADLHYADTPEYATGHGVSAGWDLVDGACRVIRTAWIPRATVERTETDTATQATRGNGCNWASWKMVRPQRRHWHLWSLSTARGSTGSKRWPAAFPANVATSRRSCFVVRASRRIAWSGACRSWSMIPMRSMPSESPTGRLRWHFGSACPTNSTKPGQHGGRSNWPSSW